MNRMKMYRMAVRAKPTAAPVFVTTRFPLPSRYMMVELFTTLMSRAVGMIVLLHSSDPFSSIA